MQKLQSHYHNLSSTKRKDAHQSPSSSPSRPSLSRLILKYQIPERRKQRQLRQIVNQRKLLTMRLRLLP